ncbi:MAG: IS630 family transposase [Planctomycetes bacterium]|nr:IS630 family transposase [Planctomycetota bacterium]
MRPHGSAEELERRRRRGVALLQKGHGVREVARMVGVTPGAVVAWRDAYEKKGEAGLAAKPHPGRKPKLSLAQRKKLIRFLKKGPQANGYKTDLWTLPRVAEVIRKRFGVRYDPSHVWRILDALDWSAQKPERRARERDEQGIARWPKQDWPRIKKSAKDRA